MDKFLNLHHSIGDWEYQSGGYWFADDSKYVSEPSSLCRPFVNCDDIWSWVMLKSTVCSNLSAGRITTYHWFSANPSPGWQILFRCQDFPVNGMPDNCYLFDVEWKWIYLYSRVDSSYNLLEVQDLEPWEPTGQWNLFRFSFYRWWDAGLNYFFRFRVEWYIGGNWIVKFDYDIESPLWDQSNVNYFGFRARGNLLSYKHWFDDTLVERQI